MHKQVNKGRTIRIFIPYDNVKEVWKETKVEVRNINLTRGMIKGRMCRSSRIQ
jgi:hypothetical protein